VASNAEDAMLEPSNSCGDQSNQICHLFLGAEKAKEFSDIPYEDLIGNGGNLAPFLNQKTKNMLFRFEVDRAITPTKLHVFPELSSLSKLNQALESGASYHGKLFLLGATLCYVNSYNVPQVLTLSELDTQHLMSLVMSFEVTEPMVVIIEDPFLRPVGMPYLEKEDQFMASLLEVVERNIEGVDFGWCSTHSFTAYVPMMPDESFKLYMYQAFLGRHTLSQWFQAAKFEAFSEIGAYQYMEHLTDLVNARNRDEVKQAFVALFTLGGADERRMLTNPLFVAPVKMRLKFKASEVIPEMAFQNLQVLQAYIDENYSADTRVAQVELYKEEAKQSICDRLEYFSAAQEEPDEHSRLQFK
nr:hypothetical protein [Gammaproteobacteria bacterium]